MKDSHIDQLKVSDDFLLSKIVQIRNTKVILDRDLAQLFDVKAIRLREQVKRNSMRFPSHFMLTLTDSEIDFLVSQNAIPSRKHLGGSHPAAFTEHGVLMLANVLKSEKAIQVSIRIIELFVKMRELLTFHSDLKLELEKLKSKVSEHDDTIRLVFEYIEQLVEKNSEPRTKIGFLNSD